MSTQVMIKIIPVLLGSRYIERLERDSLSCTDHLFLFRSAMSSHLKYLYHFCFFYTEKSVVPVSLVIGVVCIYFLIFRNIRQTSVVSDKKYFKVRKACCLFPTEDKNRMRSLPWKIWHGFFFWGFIKIYCLTALKQDRPAWELFLLHLKRLYVRSNLV